MFHAGAAFQGQAARIVRNALAHDSQDITAFRIARVGDGKELRRVHAAFADGNDTAHVALFQIPLIQHFYENSVSLAKSRSRINELPRRQFIRRHVDEIADKINTFVNGRVDIAKGIEIFAL